MAEYNLNYLLKGKLTAIDKETGERFEVLIVRIKDNLIWLNKKENNWWGKADKYNFYIVNEEYKPIWSEIRSDFEDEDKYNVITYIDAWETGNNDEEGRVIATVTLNKSIKEISVEYYDIRAKTDINTQEYINEIKNKYNEWIQKL
jgi:ABC-type cobalt transport system substrate-binding protein